MAAIYNFSIEKSIPFQKMILLKNSDNSVKDLTGYSARMQIKPYKGSKELLIDLSTTNLKLRIDIPTGAVTIILSSDDTDLLHYTKSVYDLILIKEEKTFKALEGNITVSMGVTEWKT